MSDSVVDTNDPCDHESAAENAGRAWATGVRQSLLLDGRAAAGGWPGTLSEARTRMAEALHGVRLSNEEHGHLTRVLYEAAKGSWLRRRVRSPAEE